MGVGEGMGTLYVVGTPIGNLGDMTFRALETLRAVSLIVAEDTRRARVLLNHFDIDKPTLSLFEHNEAARVPHTAQITTSNIQNCSADLNITIRLRIVDLRPFEPKIILQEMIHDTHHIPRQFTRANFYQVSWENEHFHISPLGLAHAELVKDLCNRLEEYILRTRDF